MRNKLLWALAIISSFILIIFLYTLLHEGGHALVGMIFGGKIVDFNLDFITMTAHVGMDGTFTKVQQTLISLAGVSLPLLVWLLAILVLPRMQNPVAELLKLMASLIVLNTLLAWIIVPIVVWAGNSVADDSASFLSSTGIPPLAMAGAALGVYLAGMGLYFRRAGGFRAVQDLMREGYLAMGTQPARRVLGGIVGFVALAAVAGVATGAFSNGGTFYSGIADAPEGFNLLAEVDLAQTAGVDQALGSFSLEQAGRVGAYISIQNFHTANLEIALVGPDGFRSVIVQGQDYSGSHDRIQTAWDLQPGAYQMVVTSEDAKGKLGVYLNLGE